jgi:hypothetical protein
VNNVAVARNRQPFAAQKLDVEKPPTKSDDVQMRVMKPVFVFGKFERPSAAFEMLFPKSAPLQFGKSVFDSLCRLLPIFFFVRLRQDQMNRRNFAVKHKTAHRWQVFTLKFPRPPSTTVRAKAKFAGEVWNYSVNVLIRTEKKLDNRMTPFQLVRQFDLAKSDRQPRQMFLCRQPLPRPLGARALILTLRLCYPIIKIGTRGWFSLRLCAIRNTIR